MASNVVVLCEGNRQVVKTTPTMALKQIVNTVCTKRKLDPEKYGLKLNKTILDLSLSVRFANLAPGAKLELVRLNAPKVQKEVTVALQLGEEGRFMSKFMPNTSLWDILSQVEKQSPDGSLNITHRTAKATQANKSAFKKLIKPDNTLYYQQPVCILSNNEFSTISALKSTTLQSLGLTSGNILIRVLFRHTNLTLDEAVAEIMATADVGASTAKTSSGATTSSSAHTPIATRIETSTTPLTASPRSQQPSKSTNLSQAVRMETTEMPPTTANPPAARLQEDAGTTDNLSTEIEEKGRVEGGGEMVEPELSGAKGIEMQGQMKVEKKETDEKKKMDAAATEIETKGKMVIEESDIENKEKTEGVKDKEIGDNMDIDEEEPKFFDRNVKVYNPPPANMQITHIELPDSFYELTPTELKYLIAMQKAKNTALENAVLKTKAVREQEEVARERKYPKTLIRIRFPDRTQLEGSFLSKEPVEELYKFVREAVRTPAREFYLFIAPPKKVLDDMRISLYKAELSPASIVHFNWSDKQSDDPPYLNSTYLLLRQDLIHSTDESVPTSTSFISESADSHSRGYSLKESSSQVGGSKKNERAASASGSTSGRTAGRSDASSSGSTTDSKKQRLAKLFKFINK
ncbi:325_t:CDS:2 [Paraglomus occultum]|uniref:325_t:CDS:1 n=1 Tax=Paraglomus occultum TaxID=144539 RepID=A0A9N8W291_9GLOM|nr:325_t:CDS:2 [Paraglomus occultum]